VAIGGGSMNIGQIILLLKENMKFKNYQEFGKFVDLPGDWINDLAKRQEITTIDIQRLMKIANKFNITLDWLVSDDSNINEQKSITLLDDDISKRLSDIQKDIDNGIFEGTPMNKEVSKLAIDAIEVVKSLIRQNL
jgi:transcriptional regulator with XRE-family HTH domain